tara:strand:- start:229 stop:333 length:105 start_codon:yes stop_codon:yes gene_type:complete
MVGLVLMVLEIKVAVVVALALQELQELLQVQVVV